MPPSRALWPRLPAAVARGPRVPQRRQASLDVEPPESELLPPGIPCLQPLAAAEAWEAPDVRVPGSVSWAAQARWRGPPPLHGATGPGQGPRAGARRWPGGCGAPRPSVPKLPWRRQGEWRPQLPLQARPRCTGASCSRSPPTLWGAGPAAPRAVTAAATAVGSPVRLALAGRRPPRLRAQDSATALEPCNAHCSTLEAAAT
mmetsp:Transcript_81394/g.252624  ORF Transcript_81394/g.252624 Transcript_81394/m.252624 type:complete len:202 (-) Transcript_81394:13-618(-)